MSVMGPGIVDVLVLIIATGNVPAVVRKIRLLKVEAVSGVVGNESVLCCGVWCGVVWCMCVCVCVCVCV